MGESKQEPNALAKVGASLILLQADPYHTTKGLAQQLSELTRKRQDKGKEGDSTKSEEEDAGPNLLDPAQLLDQVLSGVKDAIRQAVLSNLVGYVRFFSIRTMVGCALLEGIKALARRATRRAPRKVRRVVLFVTDATLPTGFFGPVFGVTVGVLQITGKLPALGIGSKPRMSSNAQKNLSNNAEAAGIEPGSLISAVIENAGAAMLETASTAVIETAGLAGFGGVAPPAPDRPTINLPSDSPIADVAPLFGLPTVAMSSEQPSSL